MTESSPTRTRVAAGCSREFKAKVEDYARRHRQTVADVVIDALADLLRFDAWEQATAHTSAKDDWEMQVELARRNSPLD